MKILDFSKIICTLEVSKRNDSEFPFGFTLCFNGKLQAFRSKEENIIKEWVQVLSKCCVNLDFEKKFKVLNKLGAGGYARVLLQRINM